MKFPRCPVIIFFLAALVAVRVVAASDGKKKEPPPKAIYEPAAEAKLAECLKELGDARCRLWVASMRVEAAAIAKITGLDSVGIKKLEAEAPRVADLCLGDWINKVETIYREEDSRDPDAIMEWFERLLTMAPVYAGQITVKNYAGPLSHPAWAEAVQHVLTPEQHVAWIKGHATRQQAFRDEIAVHLKPLVESAREKQRSVLFDGITNLNLYGKLSKETGEKLESLAKAVAGEVAETSRENVEARLLALEPDRRAEVLKNRNFYFGTDDAPDWRKTWKEGVSKSLSSEELSCWEKAQQAHTERRTHVLGALAVLLLDEKLALNGSQRQQLEPLLEKVLPDQAWMYPDYFTQFSLSFSRQSIYEAGTHVPEADLKGILDELQWRRWQELDASTKRPATSLQTRQPKGDAAVDTENAISNFLQARAVRVKKQLFANTAFQAENVARVAGVEPGLFCRLQSAARGAGEEILADWREKADLEAHAQLEGADELEVPKRLADLEVDFPANLQINQKAVWLKTLETELNESQRALLRQAEDERGRYRRKTICSIILAEFDRKTVLNGEQWEKIELLVFAALEEYGPDLALMYPSESTPWYLQGYLMLLPLASIPENDFKSILAKDQWDSWALSNQFAYNTRNFQSLKTRHQQRMKEAKQ
ncbi:MAG: hypothetical protein JWL59_450 [Chthoniobacteraceae bacterium]|nr:hypothetical protein [Chthoniobacteraceae bacterium]